MRNYQYIIAGLPDIALDFENGNFDIDVITRHILEHLSQKDIRLTDWVRFGLKEENLCNHFYRGALKSKNRFVREYFNFDLMLRNIQAAHIARKSQQNPDLYLVGNSAIVDALKSSKAPDFGISTELEFAPKLIQILENPNILEREQLIDQLRWNKANEICTFSYFNINVILSFILKSHILKRWSELDKKRGSLLFKQLIDEVRGTYKLNKE
ncbi:MAG: DUF2764 family protein [Rikenellaceae bacterium]